LRRRSAAGRAACNASPMAPLIARGSSSVGRSRLTTRLRTNEWLRTEERIAPCVGRPNGAGIPSVRQDLGLLAMRFLGTASGGSRGSGATAPPTAVMGRSGASGGGGARTMLKGSLAMGDRRVGFRPIP
jgi:hypothetical protein